MTAQEQFLAWLKETPAALARVVEVLDEFRKDIGALNVTPSDKSLGGYEFKEGKAIPVTTKAISDEELKELTAEYADATVVEKAVEFVKGFIAGLSAAA